MHVTSVTVHVVFGINSYICQTVYRKYTEREPVTAEEFNTGKVYEHVQRSRISHQAGQTDG